ncbi:hypothetical protein ACF0H5_006002 [Mactra antiquata]
MYKQYVKTLQTGSPDESSKKQFRKKGTKESKTGKELAIPAYKEYSYSPKKRRRLNFWDRDREMYYKTWRKLVKDLMEREKPPTRESSPEPPKPKPPKPEKLVKVLHVQDVNLNIAENAEKHRTSQYDCISERENDEGQSCPAECVVRRGDFMKITLTLDRPYEKKAHDMRLIFTTGKDSVESKGTRVQFKIDEDGKKTYNADKWGGYLESCDGNKINVMVYIAADCIIGEWTLCVRTFAKGKNKKGEPKTIKYLYEHDEDINILFNPWCKDDGTYMEDSELLKEYILNESGCVYRGNTWTRGAKPWNFGQFEDGILDIAMYLLRYGFKGKIKKDMGDPVKVSRILAKMVNACDDNGVLVGNWSGEYDDGVSPTAWAGSPKILKQFSQSGPVKYGQCWVFSCLLTTVCRAVGIPCRTVTNFSSAHDTNESNSIDKYYIRKEGKLELDECRNADSVWNFHVWNEVWLERPDLGRGKVMDGWQVIDATPQETSDGEYTCGPAPLYAIKHGDCSIQYDVGFVFTEVNADEVCWKILDDDSTEKFKVKTTKIGKCISTKVPDGKPFQDETYGEGGFHFDRIDYDEKKRLDVTDCYKFQEGSKQEREAVLKAHQTAKCPIKGIYDIGEVKEDIKFKLNHSNEVMIGCPLVIDISAKNVGSKARQISYVHISVKSKTYTGQAGPEFFDKYFGGTQLSPGEETKFEVTMTHEDYLENLVEQAGLQIDGLGVVDSIDETSDNCQETTKSHDFRFRRPDLTVETIGEKNVKKGETAKFKVSFKNPLRVPLTNCLMTMESAGFRNREDEKQPDVKVDEEYCQEFFLNAKKKGTHDVNFSFDCRELKDISGSGVINIV